MPAPRPARTTIKPKKDPRQQADRLISGRLREKSARRGAARTTVTVDGTEYVWAYRHGWVVFGKGIKAMSLSVSLEPGRTRELVLDFTLKVDDEVGAPAESRVLEVLQDGVRLALDAGWRPDSRGRAFRYSIDEGR